MEKIEPSLLENLNEFIGFARKRLRDPDLAADVVQESLLKALKAADQIQNEESARAWFYRILRRTIIDLYRRQDVRKKAISAFEREFNQRDFPEEDRMVCACIERLLLAMPRQYAELIREVDLKEADPQAVAARLGISKNNLNVRIHRARQQLKQRLEENCRVCAEHGCLDCHCGSDVKPT